jgi:hypothetical protein
LAQSIEAKRHTIGLNQELPVYLCATEMEHVHCFSSGTQMSKIIFSKFCDMNPRNIITAAVSINQYVSSVLMLTMEVCKSNRLINYFKNFLFKIYSISLNHGGYLQ